MTENEDDRDLSMMLLTSGPETEWKVVLFDEDRRDVDHFRVSLAYLLAEVSGGDDEPENMAGLVRLLRDNADRIEREVAERERVLESGDRSLWSEYLAKDKAALIARLDAVDR